MRRIEGIGNEGTQQFTVTLLADDIVLLVRYFNVTQCWYVDVTYQGRAIKGVKLSVGVLLLKGANLPFELAVTDNSGSGVDPFSLTDFSSERCALYLLEPSEVEEIRGFPVEV